MAVAAAPVKPISFATLTARADPHLLCQGSGEIFGIHPGWLDGPSQKLTTIPLGNSNFGIYWCPAAAPRGVGQISYTVTSSLGGISCETTALSCYMSGISDTAKLWLMATDETGSYSTGSLAIANSGIPVTCKKELDICNPGPAIRSFPNFGNSAPEGIGDCTFAAVANWELVTLGLKADPDLIKAQFNAAGGTYNLGLTTDQVFNYWKVFGIAGIFATQVITLPTDPTTLKRSIDDSGTRAVIASLSLIKNQNFAGTSNPNASYHWVVVVGYTPQGPLVVTWGQTMQMTWQQWNLESVTMWKISTGSQA